MAYSDIAQKHQPILLGLLGQSLGHSLSPVIHQAFLDELGFSGHYNKIEVADSALVAGKLLELAAEGYSGLNVTIPYKLAVLPSLTLLDQSAELAGAVNTIKFDQGLTGFNTDTSGLAEALSKLDLDIGNSAKVLIMGSGGAARAAIIAVSYLGFKRLEIFSRSKNNAQAMLDQLLQTARSKSLVQNCREAALASFDELLSPLSPRPLAGDFGGQVLLLVNATPIGQKDDQVPLPLIRLLTAVAKNSKHAVFVDLVYGKSLTPLCSLAQELGFAQVEDGKEMLINQARLAFKIWTGHLPDGRLARERLK